MAKSFTFKAYTSASDGTIFGYLGTYAAYLIENCSYAVGSTGQNLLYVAGIDNFKAQVGSYVSLNMIESICHPYFSWYQSEIISELLPSVIEIVPPVTSYHVTVVSEVSGYYAVSQGTLNGYVDGAPASTGSALGNWDLYDDQGNSLGSSAKGFCFPFYTPNGGWYGACAGNFEDGGLYVFDVVALSSSTTGNFRLTRHSGLSTSGRNWLRHCVDDPKQSIATFNATLDRYNWRYTGEFITPTLTITNPGLQEVLVENTDYTKTYTNNLNPGTANVLAAGIGNYTGSLSVDFYIIATDITISVNCTLNKYTWEYTGEFITPEVQVWDTLEEVQLTSGVDYQYTYTNNLNVGTATVTIVGIGNWTGSVTLEFHIISGDDPYDPGGGDPSGPEGGGGDHDDQSEDIPFPTLPTLNAVDTGFCTIYVPTLVQLNSIATYMWATDWTNILNKLVANPIDTILGLSIVPCAVSYDVGTFMIGNYQTSLSINIAQNQYVMVDCGNLTIEEFWGAYLDYSPFTKIDIYLPFIGIRALNPDDVMGKEMRMHYYIDIVTGQCMAIIRVAGSVLYSFAGSCSISLPITSNNYGQILISAAVDIVRSGSVALTSPSPAAATTAIESVSNISKDQVERSGSFSGQSGFLGVRTPYVIITRPRDCVPAQQNKYTGYPIYSTVRLDQLTGYTKVSDIQLDTVPATKNELDELYSILTQGFIIQ